MRERDRSAQEAAKARAISSFLVDLLKSADPWQGGARQTTVVDALAAGVKQVNAGRIADPVVAASVRRTIATAYQGLGRLADADTLYRATPAGAPRAGRPRERGDRRELERPRDHAHLAGKARLGRDLPSGGRWRSAARHGGADTVMAGTLLDLSDLANTKGEAARGDSLAHEALAILRRAAGERDLAVAAAMARVQSTQLGSRRAGEGRVHRPRGGRDAARARPRAAPADGPDPQRSRDHPGQPGRADRGPRGGAPDGGARLGRCSAPRIPISPPISRTSATSTTRPASGTARR